MNTDQLIEAIAAATSENDHSGAIILLAVLAGSPDQITEAERLRSEHHRIGYMPKALSAAREKLADALHAQAEAAMSVYDYARLLRAL